MARAVCAGLDPGCPHGTAKASFAIPRGRRLRVPMTVRKRDFRRFHSLLDQETLRRRRHRAYRSDRLVFETTTAGGRFVHRVVNVKLRLTKPHS